MKSKRVSLLSKLALLMAALIWGSTAFVLKTTLDSVPTAWTNAIRFTVGALVLGIVFFKRLKNIDREYWLHGCLMDREIVDDLDYYCDHLHHSREACRLVLEKIAGEDVLLTKENVAETLANWRRFVVNYDYEKFWDESFWVAWNAAKAAS